MTDFFLRDVGITQFQFNVGQQLLSAGIVILEVSCYRKMKNSEWLTQTLDPE